MTDSPTLEKLILEAEHLSTDEQFALVSALLSRLRVQHEPIQPKRSLYGLVKDTGNAPSAADIDHARQEMWGNFPREDI
ncbi:MAG: hypothetical protein ACOYL5_15720 [Phototrophicaceae bacterium]|jgi:hypothetical protein